MLRDIRVGKEGERDKHTPLLLALKMEEGGHKPSKGGSSVKAEKTREWIVSWCVREKGGLI